MVSLTVARRDCFQGHYLIGLCAVEMGKGYRSLPDYKPAVMDLIYMFHCSGEAQKLIVRCTRSALPVVSTVRRSVATH